MSELVLRRVPGWLALVILAAACGDSSSTGGGTAAAAGDAPTTHEQGVALAAPVYDALAEMARNFPDMKTLQPKRCAEKPKWMGGMSWNDLMQVTGGELSAADKEVSTILTAADVGRLSRLPARDQPAKYFSGAVVTEAVEEFGRRSHLAILRLDVGKATAGGNAAGLFEGGAIAGHLVVFDVATRKPVCNWPVAAKSSDTVHYSVGMNDGAQRRDEKKLHALKQDFGRQIEKALSQAKTAMIPQ